VFGREHPEANAAVLVNHYAANRSTIEPAFRDTKDLRFGYVIALLIGVASGDKGKFSRGLD
jgi:hypothetical protein